VVFFALRQINVLQTLNYIQLTKHWSEPEEIFNVIGFTKVDNNIYVNRFSDLDILKTARWGYVPVNYNLIPSDKKIYLLKILEQREFLQKNANAWDILCKLHHRINVEYICTNTKENIEKYLSSLEFND